MSHLTPKEIVDELDKYIIGQDKAKKAVAIALRNRYRRQQLDRELQDEITPKNIIMVGPTGVGKTTTVAKIAAKAIVESRLKVSLITVDTYRIGASEQIARYGSIMRVPTFVARDRDELAVAMEKSKDADLVLIDTAGRAVSEAVARQAELLRTVPGVQLFLVLSAATGPRELAAAADRYRRLAPERVIFSKVDEAVAPGSVLSAAVRINRPVACIADGQRVPEDLHAVTSDELTGLVLGAWDPAVGQTARRS